MWNNVNVQLRKSFFSMFAVLVVWTGTLNAQGRSFEMILPGQPNPIVGLDSLALSCIVLEGRLIEKDFLQPDPGYWSTSATVINSVNDTLFAVSDTSSLGIQTALSLKNDLLDHFEISEYILTARFPSGVFLPVREFAIDGAFVYYKIYPIEPLIAGYDYEIHRLYVPAEELSTGQNAWVAGPVTGIPHQVISTTFSNIPGSLSDPGSAMSDRTLSELITLDKGNFIATFSGAPVFASINDSEAALVGICLPNEGVASEMVTSVRPLRSIAPSSLQLQWRVICAENFSSLLL